MMFKSLVLLCSLGVAHSFAPAVSSRSASSTALNIVYNEDSSLEKIRQILTANDFPDPSPEFDAMLKQSFPYALTNQELEARVVSLLGQKGYTGRNTLLATSLCCDELARRLEDDFVRVYGNNFNLGGLSGFPFAGNTGFGAMAAHIPDDGNCLIIYGPHVGITEQGEIGKVERDGIALVDNCCGSAIAASKYLQGITDGGADITAEIQSFTDFQQNVVRELILPHGRRLTEAPNRMLDLPYALYESQDLLLRSIIKKGAAGLKRGTALLGGVQINTGPQAPDYFHPLRFDFLDSSGEVVENLLPLIAAR